MDACVRLAELAELNGDFEISLDTLEKGIAIDPYAENLYQRAIKLLVSLRRSAVAGQLFQQLRTRLNDLDLEPDPETVRLLKQTLSSAVVGSVSDPNSRRTFSATSRENFKMEECRQIQIL